MDRRPVIYWFRQDLRLADLPGLAAAAAEAQPAAVQQVRPAATGTGGGGLIARSKLSAAIAREDGMRASGGTSGAALGNLAKRMRKLEG